MNQWMDGDIYKLSDRLTKHAWHRSRPENRKGRIRKSQECEKYRKFDERKQQRVT